MNVVINLRCTAGLTQAELARVAGKSQPTVVAYESGTESPTLKSLSRIARAAGLEAVVNFPPAMTREDHRGLALHRAIAHHLAADPAGTVARARLKLTAMRDCSPQADDRLAKWDDILESWWCSSVIEPERQCLIPRG